MANMTDFDKDAPIQVGDVLYCDLGYTMSVTRRHELVTRRIRRCI